jgi:hypothetical protein
MALWEISRAPVGGAAAVRRKQDRLNARASKTVIAAYTAASPTEREHAFDTAVAAYLRRYPQVPNVIARLAVAEILTQCDFAISDELV